jgi:prepilin-type processing-associated H-X9-DG protein
MTPRISYLLLLGGGLLLLGCMGLSFPFEIVFYLATGWVFYLGRVVPEITISWSSVALAVLCLVVVAGLTHSFLGWLYRSVAITKEAKWKLRWTGALVAGVVLMFVAGISATGIAHQTGWLFTSGEPWLASVSTAARRAQSVNNLKQIGLALSNYAEVEGTMPQAASLDAEGRLLHGWQARMLPYLEQQDLFNKIDFTRPWDDPRNEAVFRTRVNTYLNPGIRERTDGPGLAPSHYAGNVLVLGGDSARKLDSITDGRSNTIAAGEVPGDFKPWGHPANWRDLAKGINQSRDGFGGPYKGGANFLFADGSVRFIKDSVDPKVLRALSTPAGGETLRYDY